METSYDFRPEFTYTVNPRIEIRQTYGLNIEFTEFDFNPNDNFLDRNFTFTNNFKTHLTPRLTTDVYYQLRLHDRGSYLAPEPGQERLLDIEQEDRRDQMTISFRYDVTPSLAMLGKTDYSQRREEQPAFGTSTTFTDGGLELGVEGNYQWGNDRRLTLRLIKANRFGQFSSPEQENYWIMDTTLNYAF